MDKNEEKQETRQTPEVEVPKETEEQPAPKAEEPQEDLVKLSKAEFEELTHKAKVSDDNYARLQKEKERREELEQLNYQDDSFSDNDEVSSLRQTVSQLQAKADKDDVLKAHPELESVWSEFETFRQDPENTGMNIKTAAKAFVVEKELNTPKRQGLEKSTGGTHEPVTPGMSTDEVRDLRSNDYKKYRDMLKKGQIKLKKE